MLAEHTVTDPYAHAERLMPLAQAALAESGHRLPDLDAIVVGLGPGPFTGLRVGIATAAALGDALDVPVHGVPSHDALARCVGPLTGDLLVVTDARRREVYLSAYRRDGRRLFGPLVVRPDAVPDLLSEHGMRPAQLAGPGAPLLDGIRRAAGPSTRAAAAVPADPLSGGLVERAGLALLTGAVPGPLDPAVPAPSGRHRAGRPAIGARPMTGHRAPGDSGHGTDWTVRTDGADGTADRDRAGTP